MAYFNGEEIIEMNEVLEELLQDLEALKFQKEENRLKSFSNWPLDFIKPTDLAAAGLYYCEEGDKVRCFACKIEISKWNTSDKPMEEHRKWSEKCPFVKGEECGNVKINDGEDVCERYTCKKEPLGVPPEKQCKICLWKEMTVVFLPCTHLCSCMDCAMLLHDCPMCRAKIEHKLKIYFT